jgi:hypothetical protein
MQVAMMLRVHLLLAAVLLCTSCRLGTVRALVHVLPDPSASFARNLRNADLQFGLTKPHLKSGKGTMVATNVTRNGGGYKRRVLAADQFCFSDLVSDARVVPYVCL